LDLREEVPARAVGDGELDAGLLFKLRGEIGERKLKIGSSGNANLLGVNEWYAGTEENKQPKQHCQNRPLYKETSPRVLVNAHIRDPSDAKDHHFGRFDQRCRALARLQSQFLGGVGRDDGRDVLLADGQRNLGEEAAEL